MSVKEHSDGLDGTILIHTFPYEVSIIPRKISITERDHEQVNTSKVLAEAEVSLKGTALNLDEDKAVLNDHISFSWPTSQFSMRHFLLKL